MLTFIHKWRNVQMYKMWPKVISCALQSLVSKCCFAKILVLLGTFNHWDDDDALDDYDEECWRWGEFWRMLWDDEGSRGGSAGPSVRPDQITISTKINFASLLPPPPPNLTSLVEGQVTGKKDGKADQKKAKRHSFFQIEITFISLMSSVGQSKRESNEI